MARPATAAVRLLAGEREPVRLATTGNISLSGLKAIDGVMTAIGDRVLVKDQTDKKQNGIYTASAGVWFRASDARDSRAITEGVTVHVQEGTTNNGRAYRFNTVLPKIGTDLIYVDFYLSASFAADAEAVIDAKKAEISDYVTSTVNAGKEEINATAQAASALSRAWAEGTVPGGPGTLSSKEWAELAETTFETNAAAVIPSVQRFAVGGAVQSVDTGKPGLVAASARVFIDGVYQFSNTWSVAAGVITPVGGAWPGDGVTENMEVIVDATSSITFNVPSDGAVDENKLSPEVRAKVLSPAMQTGTPFGQAGIRVLRGEKYDAHYGLPSGWIVFPSGKWTLIYRKASSHAIKDGAEVRAADSYDRGATLVNDRLIYSDPTHDARPDTPRLCANNRAVFTINRQDEGAVFFPPLLVYSDDEFVTVQQKVIPLASPNTFSSTGGIIDFPASQGGHDTLGFIAFGFADNSGYYDALYTTDNWETIGTVGGVANVGAPSTGTPITSLSEWGGARIGNQDKWIFYLRCQDAGGWRDEAACFVTTNLLNWGTPKPSNINLGGNPPCCFFDAATNKFHFIAFGRGGRGIDGFDHHMLIASADGDALWSANGNWDALTPPVDWEIVTPLPNWTTGYMSPVKVDDHWVGTFVCGEPGSAGGDRSILAMIGDFIPTTADVMKLVEASRWNAIFKTVRVGYGATTVPPVDAYINALVDGVSAGFSSYNAGTATRTHYTIQNANGEVGSITAGGSSTNFNTTSDGRLKINRAHVEEDVDLDAVWEAFVPLAYSMLSGKTLEQCDGRHFGMIAQDLYRVFPQAVTPGEGEPGEDQFKPWEIDYSKLMPIVIARQKQQERRTDARLAALEGDSL